jgi:hypothetical protein
MIPNLIDLTSGGIEHQHHGQQHAQRLTGNPLRYQPTMPSDMFKISLKPCRVSTSFAIEERLPTAQYTRTVLFRGTSFVLRSSSSIGIRTDPASLP